MGYGDEIMAAAEARQLYNKNSIPVAIVDKRSTIRWHPIWENNPIIVNPRNVPDNYQKLRNHSGHRPYYNYSKCTKEKWVYTDWKTPYGEIYLSKEEEALARIYKKKLGDFIVVEPHVKSNASPNKCWGFDRTQRLVSTFNFTNWVQLGPKGTKSLGGVTRIITNSFRNACAVLSVANAYVGPEGGLHHAAAAFRKPGVVIFGGMTHPKNTGYDCHSNLVSDDAPCGMRLPCEHCKVAMKKIMPTEVGKQLRRSMICLLNPEGK